MPFSNNFTFGPSTEIQPESRTSCTYLCVSSEISGSFMRSRTSCGASSRIRFVVMLVSSRIPKIQALDATTTRARRATCFVRENAGACDGLAEERFAAILDNNLDKQGQRMYGTALRVLPPSSVLRSHLAPHVVLRQGAYNAEIARQLLNPAQHQPAHRNHRAERQHRAQRRRWRARHGSLGQPADVFFTWLRA